MARESGDSQSPKSSFFSRHLQWRAKEENGERGVLTKGCVLEMLGTEVTREESPMDRIPSAGFEGIAQMLLEQKKLMDALEAENRELRRQLHDLRRGVGVALVIEGKTIQLAIDQSGPTTMGAQSMQGSQNMQAGLNTSQAMPNGSYTPNTRQTGGQQPLNPNNDRRDNGRPSNPLADSFVL